MENKYAISKNNKTEWINRIALFIVFFWFGFLKIMGTSPAEGLVKALFDVTLSNYMSATTFLPCFGIIECIIGLLWLFPKLTKFAFWAMLVHMLTTFLPLVLLPKETWDAFLTLTLTGQYIVKNLVLIGSAFFLYETHSKFESLHSSKASKLDLGYS
jgi:uncharacterized membrane protein YkgB